MTIAFLEHIKEVPGHPVPGMVTGRNPKLLTSKQLTPKVWVDGSLQAFALEGEFGGVALEDVEGDVADNGEVQGGEVLSCPAAVLIE